MKKLLLLSSVLLLTACTAGITPQGAQLNALKDLTKEIIKREKDATALASWVFICEDLTWKQEKQFLATKGISRDEFDAFCKRASEAEKRR